MNQDTLSSALQTFKSVFVKPDNELPQHFLIEKDRVGTPFEIVELFLQTTIHSINPGLLPSLSSSLKNQVLQSEETLDINTNINSPLEVGIVDTNLRIGAVFSFYQCNLYRETGTPIMEIVTPLSSSLADIAASFSCNCFLLPNPNFESLLISSSKAYTDSSLYESCILNGFFDFVREQNLTSFPQGLADVRSLTNSTVADLSPTVGQELVFVRGCKGAFHQHLVIVRTIRTLAFWEPDSPRCVSMYTKPDAHLCDVCGDRGALYIIGHHPLSSVHPSFWCKFCFTNGGMEVDECEDVELLFETDV
ncbi:hypothetical protein P9112_005417 [Eukaryota sp. TZLM1-RC]